MSKRRDLSGSLRGFIPAGQNAQRPAIEHSRERLLPGARMVSIASVRPNPDQPRKHFHATALEELASSIREVGILQPLRVTQTNTPGQYLLVNGERRWRAAQMAGLDEIPVVVADTAGDRLYFEALIENLQRENLQPEEEFRAYTYLDSQGYKAHQIAASLGVPDTRVSRIMNMFNNPVLATSVVDGTITKSQAQELLPVPEEAKQAVIDYITEGKEQGQKRTLSQVREAARLAREDAEELRREREREAVRNAISPAVSPPAEAPEPPAEADPPSATAPRTPEAAISFPLTVAAAPAREIALRKSSEPPVSPGPTPKTNLSSRISARRVAIREFAAKGRGLMETYDSPPQGAIEELGEIVPTLRLLLRWALKHNSDVE